MCTHPVCAGVDAFVRAANPERSEGERACEPKWPELLLCEGDAPRQKLARGASPDEGVRGYTILR